MTDEKMPGEATLFQEGDKIHVEGAVGSGRMIRWDWETARILEPNFRAGDAVTRHDGASTTAGIILAISEDVAWVKMKGQGQGPPVTVATRYLRRRKSESGEVSPPEKTTGKGQPVSETLASHRHCGGEGKTSDEGGRGGTFGGGGGGSGSETIPRDGRPWYRALGGGGGGNRPPSETTIRPATQWLGFTAYVVTVEGDVNSAWWDAREAQSRAESLRKGNSLGPPDVRMHPTVVRGTPPFSGGGGGIPPSSVIEW